MEGRLRGEIGTKCRKNVEKMVEKKYLVNKRNFVRKCLKKFFGGNFVWIKYFVENGLGKNFWGEKILGEKLLGEKIFGEKFLGKNFLGKIILGEKNFGGKIFGEKILWEKNIVGKNLG